MAAAPSPETKTATIVVSVLAVLSIFSLSVAADLAVDTAALLSLRNAVGRYVLGWNTSVPTCSWPGVECGSSRVTGIHLPGVGLMGQLPSGVFSNLTELHTLSLRFNALAGAIPSDIATLAELRNLYLQGNRFSGEIPSFMFGMSNLVRLNLARNNFSGPISPSFNNLTRLGTLYLELNNFSGEIPAIDLPDLVQFNVSFNKLNGSIPQKLRSQPANAFLGMRLCGGPLGLCPGEAASSPIPPFTPGGSSRGGGLGGGVQIGGTANKKSKLSGGAIAGIVIGAVLGFLLLLFLLCCCWRRMPSRKTEGPVKSAGSEISPQAEKTVEEAVPNGHSVPAVARAPPAAAAAAAGSSKKLVFFSKGPTSFDLEDLLRASAEVLGKGTFGTAYKAVLETGPVVAVKRLRDVTIPEVEFREKIDAIGAMSHPNLVPLRAYYFSKDEKLLVYDYMPLGSLSALLHGNRGSGRAPLDWQTRTAIALAAAHGIEYIHLTGPSCSHGNIKASNILIGRSYDAFVSDQGLSQLVGPVSTPNRVAGYRAPEVTDARKVSQKADVYSFGVLILELLTGKAPAQALLNEEGVDLPRWVQSVVREEWTSEVFDLELLRYQNMEEEMVHLLQLAVDCVAQYPDRRPSMSDVVVRLQEIHNYSLGAVEQEKQIDSQAFDADGQAKPTDVSHEPATPEGIS